MRNSSGSSKLPVSATRRIAASTAARGLQRAREMQRRVIHDSAIGPASTRGIASTVVPADRPRTPATDTPEIIFWARMRPEDAGCALRGRPRPRARRSRRLPCKTHSRSVPSSSRNGAARADMVRQLPSRRRKRNVIEHGRSALTMPNPCRARFIVTVVGMNEISSHSQPVPSPLAGANECQLPS